ncbi:MAG: hypothetical protein NTY32_02165, partial [Bacteroidia bacterium]|nr:hypothetical protein [Bacteroidia bacterium]
TFVDLDINNLSKVLYVHDKPTLDLGKIGTFDDSGNNVCSVVRFGDLIYMYFIGWNPSTTVHTRNSIGLAISKDNGLTFQRPYDGSILDRTKDEPYYTGAVDVMKDADQWKLWYTSGSEWKMLNGKPESMERRFTACGTAVETSLISGSIKNTITELAMQNHWTASAGTEWMNKSGLMSHPKVGIRML